LAGTPLGLLLSLIGLLFDRDKKAAIAGLVIAGIVVLAFCLNSLC
jgi:hypothetical protein